MWLPTLTVLLASVVPLHATMVYGRCPVLKTVAYEPFRTRLFEGKNGAILYFSNVRFQAFFDDRLESTVIYSSHYNIVLEHRDGCFQPFQLHLAGAQMAAPEAMYKRDSVTIISAAVVGMHGKDYLFAFSCVQVGHNKLEYVWIFGRAGRFGIGLGKVQQMFGHLLANMSTELKDLRRTHHEFPFCTSILWSTVVYGVGGALTLLVMTAGIVCWKKHRQILLLRRRSCAECEDPGKELELNVSERRDITSARTVAVMHGAII